MLNSAAKFWHDSISASVPQCLRAAKFTNKELGDRALQMKLRRGCTTRDGAPCITATSTTKRPLPASVCVTTGAAATTSDLSNSASSLLKFPPPKLPHLCNVICVQNSRHQNKDTTTNLCRGSHAWIPQRRHACWPFSSEGETIVEWECGKLQWKMEK